MSSDLPQENTAVRTTASAALSFTKLTNHRGLLTKTHRLNDDGQPTTTSSAALYDGRAETIRCLGITNFLGMRDDLKPNEAFMFGVARSASVAVTTLKNLRDHPAEHAGKIARDSKSFHFPEAPGILMLDHDAGHMSCAYDRVSLREELLGAVPELATAAMAWAPSASSYIYALGTEEEIHGLRGQRLYVSVLDASDIPRLGKAIYERLWAAGIGMYAVSAGGQLLDRNLFDASVWQAERIDFAAGAKCIAPLEQRPGGGCEWNATAEPWDSRTLLLDLTPEQVAAAATHRAAARELVTGKASAARIAYANTRAEARATSGGISIEEARRQVHAELTLQRLAADFVLHPEEGGTVTVAEVVADPKKWNGLRFADPIEPGYREDQRIAWLNLDNPDKPFLYSHAHGLAQRYTLDTLSRQDAASFVTEIEALVAAAQTGDVGAPFEPTALDALRALKERDLPGWVRARELLKKAGVRVGELEKELRHGDGAPPEAAEETVADKLIDLARGRCKFMRDANRVPYAVFEASGARQVYGVSSSGFSDFLTHAYYSEHDRAPTDLSLKVALATLRGQAQFDGELCEVFTRIAKTDAGYWLDLCNDAWQCIQITPTGWAVVAGEAAPLFTRSASMWPLPVPERGGSLDELWPLVNIRQDDRLMIVTWLLECLRADTPHPVLELIGEQGSAKSSTQSVLRRLIDPNKADLRAAPKTVDDIWIAAQNAHLVSLENLSHLSSLAQDALCVLSTGGAYATRTLYTNAEETILNLRKPIVMNGISVLATAQDLVDRCVHIGLPTIQRRELAGNMETRFAAAQPRLVGALLEQFAKALAMLPSVTIEPDKLPRMADFATLGEAVFRVQGKAEGDFLARYGAMRKDGVLRTIDASPVGAALLAYLGDERGFKGTLTVLLACLAAHRAHGETSWPKSAKGLGDALRRLAPALRMLGFECNQGGKTGGAILWTIKRSHTADPAVSRETASGF